jgi:hypothetical protein
MTTQQASGTLEDKQEKEFQGVKYATVTIDGMKLSARNIMYEAVKQIGNGSKVKYSYETGEYNGRPFSVLRAIMVERAANGNGNSHSDRDRSIIRQSSLKIAVQFLSLPGILREGGRPPLDILFDVAESVEGWVTRSEDEPIPED